jgi:1-deoxy-D-xylulose-5-phosphate reductoisomerase
MRKISILGATGSIGQNTIDLVKRAPDDYEVVALTGAQNIAQLAKDAIELRAKVAVTADLARLEELRTALVGSGVEVAAGVRAVT